jgi:tetratricopeptide (TPR) repeat protein
MNDSARPSVTELFQQYLQRQVAAHAHGLGYAEPAGDAEPHEAVPVQPVDPQLAWKDAVVAAGLLDPGQTFTASVPPEWPALVAQQEPAVALAFCLGNFPQLVRNLHPLLTQEPAALRCGAKQGTAPAAVLEWANQASGDAQRLLAAAVLRLARQFDKAAKLLADAPAPEWQALYTNELAALAWHRGEAEKALALWQNLPEGPVALFNRGMAHLFLGDRAAAKEALSRAVGLLPETSAWHHLAQLYLALAQAR